ncbi:gamma-glutamyl hydrolase-like isoform X2 [Planococcus citri]|uniref:gamma-glutamyl hydrolase-like isoform X2 n=1 Tax=Planococcus citri TaxID=170843 RepID=UPI0031FA2946
MKLTIFPNVLLIWLLKCDFIKCTKRPIIEFTNYDTFTNDPANATGFIGANYVKAVESCGARVVPIFIRQNYSYYEQIMNSINGVVLPGGKTTIKPGFPYYDASSIIFKIAKQLNDKGITFPILSICLGFQAMLTIHNNDTNLLTQCDSFYESYPLEFQPNFTRSQLFFNSDQQLFLSLKLLRITINNHKYCISPLNFTKSNLPKEWRVTSLSTTNRGVKFIATVEHIKYPFFGVQFHPEMAAFHWPEEFCIPHDRVTVRANQYFYDKLVIISTLNDNKFEDVEEERKTLIYNYNTIYCQAKPYQYYIQRYIFYN